jgi:hypothetical protein
VIVFASAAWADPAALRLPDRGVGLVVGLSEHSIGVPLGPLDVALETRTDLGAVGGSVGIRRHLGREPAPSVEAAHWRTDLGMAVGVMVPVFDPSPAWTLTPWLSTGLVGPKAYAQALVVLPMASSLGEGLRIPIRQELQAGMGIGRWRFGPRVSVAEVWTPGADVSFTADAGISVGYRL